MSNIKKYMTTLMPGIVSAANERERAVGDIKLQTASMLNTFNCERRAMVKALKSELLADRVSRSAEVLTMRTNASKMSSGFRQNHLHMRHKLRQRLVESRESVSLSVASMMLVFSKRRHDFHEAHRHMVNAMCSGLAQGRRERSNAVTDLLQSFARAHRHMAKVQYASLIKARRERSHAVIKLINGCHTSSASMVQKQAENMPLPERVVTVETVDVPEPISVEVSSLADLPAPDSLVQMVSENSDADEPVGGDAEASFAWPSTVSEPVPHNVLLAPPTKSKANQYMSGKSGKSKK